MSLIMPDSRKWGFLLIEKELIIPEHLPDLDQVTNINLQPVITRLSGGEDNQSVEGNLNIQVFYAPVQGEQLLPADLPLEPESAEKPISYLQGLNKDFFDDGFSDHDELEDEIIAVKDNFHFINLESRDWDTIACFKDEGPFRADLSAGSLVLPANLQLWPRVRFLEYKVADPKKLKLSFLVALESAMADWQEPQDKETGDYQVEFQLPANHPPLEDVVDYICRLLSSPKYTGDGGSPCWQLEMAYLSRGEDNKPILGLTRMVQEFAGELPVEVKEAGIWTVDECVLTPTGSGGVRLAVRLPLPAGGEQAEPEEVNAEVSQEITQESSAEEVVDIAEADRVNLPLEQFTLPVFDYDDDQREDFIIPFNDQEVSPEQPEELAWLQGWADCEGLVCEEVESEMGKKKGRDEEKVYETLALEDQEAEEREFEDDVVTADDIPDDEVTDDDQGNEEDQAYTGEREVDEREEDEREETADDENDEDDESCEAIGDQVGEEEIVTGGDPAESEHEVVGVSGEGLVETGDGPEETIDIIAEETVLDVAGQVEEDTAAPVAADIPEVKVPAQTGPKVAFHGIAAPETKVKKDTGVTDQTEANLSMSARRQRLQAALAKGSGAKGNKGSSVMRITPRIS